MDKLKLQLVNVIMKQAHIRETREGLLRPHIIKETHKHTQSSAASDQ